MNEQIKLEDADLQILRFLRGRVLEIAPANDVSWYPRLKGLKALGLVTGDLVHGHQLTDEGTKLVDEDGKREVSGAIVFAFNALNEADNVWLFVKDQDDATWHLVAPGRLARKTQGLAVGATFRFRVKGKNEVVAIFEVQK